MNRVLVVLLVGLAPFSQAFAGDFKWSGTYRFEGLSVSNPEASDDGSTKSYMLHHLILRPEIVAYDGLTIKSRFDIMNNDRHPNHQLGSLIGSGVRPGGTAPTTPTTNMDNSNVLSQNQASDMLRVTQLYAVWNHEFGALTVGRAPIHFGMGMSYNAGDGPFDHWLDTRDLVAYKLVMGNFYVMPVIAKVSEGNLNTDDDVNDFMIQAQYENPETELAMGVIYHSRRSSSGADSNDAPLGVFSNGNQIGNFEVDYYNFFVSQWADAIKVSFELGFAEGSTGIADANGADIAHEAFGAAVRAEYLPKDNNWTATLDLGYASGDDPNTSNRYEGYIFDRNFDVAFLMFNHPMGRYDILRSSYVNNNANFARSNASAFYDEEVISNALYGSLGGAYTWDKNLSFGTQFTYGQLNKTLNSDVDASLGFEIDLILKYMPFEGFQWVTRAGMFSPGGAFEGGTNNFSTGTVLGLETKAAISF